MISIVKHKAEKWKKSIYLLTHKFKFPNMEQVEAEVMKAKNLIHQISVHIIVKPVMILEFTVTF